MCTQKCVILHFPTLKEQEGLGELLFGSEHAMGIGAHAISKTIFERTALVLVTTEHKFSLRQVLIQNLHKLRRFAAFREYGEEEITPLFGAALRNTPTLIAETEEGAVEKGTLHALALGATEIIHVVPPDTLERRRELLVAFMNRANVSARLYIETSPQ